jgi:hypothetical protein
MPTVNEEFARLEAEFRKCRRTVMFHAGFVLLCLVGALLGRRALNYPPMLTWVVLVVPAIVFGGDVARLFISRHRLKRFLEQHQA